MKSTVAFWSMTSLLGVMLNLPCRVEAQADVIYACVNDNDGGIRIVSPS